MAQRRRLYPVLLLAAGSVAMIGCEKRPYGVDFSVDPDYDFSMLRRVAIVDPPEPAKPTGLERVLVDAASDALASRFAVVYGNRLKVAVQGAKVEDAFQTLRQQLGTSRDPDADLVRKVAKAIGVDGFYATELATLERRTEPDYSYYTVMTSSGSGYSSISQTNRTATVTTVRLTARLVDGTTGMVIWSGSKLAESSLNIESTGLKPLLRGVSEDFVLTMPETRQGAPAKGSEQMRTSH